MKTRIGLLALVLFGCGGPAFSAATEAAGSAPVVLDDSGSPVGTGGIPGTGGRRGLEKPGTGGQEPDAGRFAMDQWNLPPTETGGAPSHGTGGSSQGTGGSSQGGQAPATGGSSSGGSTGGAAVVDAQAPGTGGFLGTGGQVGTGGVPVGYVCGDPTSVPLMKLCAGSCVDPNIYNGCGRPDCMPCPAPPPNAFMKCGWPGGSCVVECLSGGC